MKKLYLLFPILFLIYWGCEEEQDTTPPTVSISSHISGQTVNGIVTIIVFTLDNEGISKVEFYIDDSLVLTDLLPPFGYEWDTEQYENNSEHTVKVISYDDSDNSTESEPIVLVVYYPEVTLWGVVYSIYHTDTLDLSASGLHGSIP
ncbi:MAG: Ig-like domain-containing protein, partial [Candidatus Neomarinimicrobiota bacterium]|nr:Ig-like domain-containing protein [Candidatus Neomarinimicrobiota bacterium]